MAYTLADISSKVGQRIRDPNYPMGEITNYLNDTINDIYNEYQLPFMQTTIDYTTTINVADVTNNVGLPANFVQAIDLIATTAGREKVIPYKDVSDADETDPDLEDTTLHPTSNSPDFWYYYANTIKVYPSPKTAYTVKLRYYKKPTMLSADDSVPEIPSQYEELLVVGATYRVLQVKDNYDQAAIFQNKYDEILDKMVMKSMSQVGAPTIMRINRRVLGKTSF